jgi:hypothetical protein
MTLHWRHRLLIRRDLVCGYIDRHECGRAENSAAERAICGDNGRYGGRMHGEIGRRRIVGMKEVEQAGRRGCDGKAGNSSGEARM